MPGIVLSLVAALVDLTCATLGYDDARVVTKPLVALILAVTAWRSGARVLATGLVAAAIGDELLLHDDGARFMAGMGAFFIMQICFSYAFARIGTIPNRWLTIPYAATFAFVIFILQAYLGTLTVPFIAYGIALAAMAWWALGVNRWTAIGGIIFMASDTTLAFGKFYPDFPLPPHLTVLLVDGSYFIAIAIIVAGVLLRRERAGDHLRSAG